MKINVFTFKTVLVSFCTLFIYCGISDTDNSTGYESIVIKEYLGLKVGNSWTYLITHLTATGLDSTIRTVKVVENIDSVWYFSIRDSLFYEPRPIQYPDPPVVTSFCDTCIQHTDNYNCLHGYNDGFFRLDTNNSIVATGSLTVDGSTYQYIKRTIGEGFPMGWSGVYYLKNIGLVKDVSYSRGPTYGWGTFIVLKSFNGVDNKTFRCFGAGYLTGIQDECL